MIGRTSGPTVPAPASASQTGGKTSKSDDGARFGEILRKTGNSDQKAPQIASDYPGSTPGSPRLPIKPPQSLLNLKIPDGQDMPKGVGEEIANGQRSESNEIGRFGGNLRKTGSSDQKAPQIASDYPGSTPGSPRLPIKPPQSLLNLKISGGQEMPKDLGEEMTEGQEPGPSENSRLKAARGLPTNNVDAEILSPEQETAADESIAEKPGALAEVIGTREGGELSAQSVVMPFVQTKQTLQSATALVSAGPRMTPTAAIQNLQTPLAIAEQMQARANTRVRSVSQDVTQNNETPEVRSVAASQDGKLVRKGGGAIPEIAAKTNNAAGREFRAAGPAGDVAQSQSAALENRLASVDRDTAPTRGSSSVKPVLFRSAEPATDFSRTTMVPANLATNQSTGTVSRQISDVVARELNDLSLARINVNTSGAPGKTLKVLRLQLNPAELGQVNIRMQSVAGELQITIRAEREQTTRMLARDGDAIRAALRAVGVSAPDVTVSIQRNDQTQAQTQDTQHRDATGQQNGARENHDSANNGEHSGDAERDFETASYDPSQPDRIDRTDHDRDNRMVI